MTAAELEERAADRPTLEVWQALAAAAARKPSVGAVPLVSGPADTACACPAAGRHRQSISRDAAAAGGPALAVADSPQVAFIILFMLISSPVYTENSNKSPSKTIGGRGLRRLSWYRRFS
jgi:hypothetical protein